MSNKAAALATVNIMHLQRNFLGHKEARVGGENDLRFVGEKTVPE
jgi:hypothetical protein